MEPEEEGGGGPHDELDLGTGKLGSAVGKGDSEAEKLDSGAGRLDLGSCELEKKAGGGHACRLARARACRRAREGQCACACPLLLVCC